MMPFKLCGEAKVAQSHYGGEGGWGGAAWQHQTELISEINSMSDVSGVDGFIFLWLDFQAKALVKQWWMCLQSVWVTNHERLHHHSLANSSRFPPKKGKKAKGTCEWCSVMTSECMAVCVQVGGWTVALRCCLCSGDSKLRIKCAALRNKVLCFGSALTLSLLNEKCVYICTHAAQRYSWLK